MTPQGTRVLKREQRRAWRGTPTGRRATRTVKTTYGRHQKLAARLAEFSAWCEERRESDPGVTA